MSACEMQRVLLAEMEDYWTKRAPSYSEETGRERKGRNDRAWMKEIHKYLPKGRCLRILDIGTGPGFFAVALAGCGHQVTAVDYTQAMLDEAAANAGVLARRIDFQRMDAQHLLFDANQFDAVVSRDLTWNLENPALAYQEWYRVLKPDGVLLNFDAGWYNYLFDQEKAQAFNQDRRRVEEARLLELNDYSEAERMERLAMDLMLSRCERPAADIDMLISAGFKKVYTDPEVWKRVWDEVQKTNNASTPCFLIAGWK